MELRWKEHAAHDARLLVVEHESGWRLIAHLPNPEGMQDAYLMPARIVPSVEGRWDRESEGLIAALAPQAASLARKVENMDRLRLSDITFTNHFVAARLAVWVPPTVETSSICDAVRDRLDELEAMTSLNLVTQIDPDQRRRHEELASVLESVNFVVQHDPTAIGAAVAFQLLLEALGIAPEEARYSINGIGDIGCRIVRLLLDSGAAIVYAQDPREQEIDGIIGLGNVRRFFADEWGELDCHAHIISSHYSFTAELGQAFAKAPTVVAVGGPEFGLDRFSETWAMLAAVNKQFVPSTLCGSLGFVCNLEESLGRMPSLRTVTDRYTALVTRLIEESMSSGRPFHVAWGDLLVAPPVRG